MPALRHVTWKSFVITANTLNFKPIFECPLLKIVGATPVPDGVCASKPWSFCSACKNLSRLRPLGSSEKVDFDGSESACSTVLLVGQGSPYFFCRTREESQSIKCLSDFGCLHSFRICSRSNFEVVRSRPKFCTFLAPNFFRGGPPKCWDLDYKTDEPDKVSRRSPDGARKSRVEKKRKKHQK